jgi:hypothetical protein
MEKTIKLSLQKAKELYQTADATFKEFLESNFDKKDLKKIDLLTISYLNSCDILKEKSYSKKDFIFEYQWIEHQLSTIIKAVNYLDNDNKEWIPDFSNKIENRYRNWFEKNKGV